MNPYLYVGTDPMRSIDPWGLYDADGGKYYGFGNPSNCWFQSSTPGSKPRRVSESKCLKIAVSVFLSGYGQSPGLLGPFVRGGTAYAGGNGGFALPVGNTTGGGLFFTAKNEYGWPDIGVYGTTGGTFGEANPGFAIGGGYVEGDYQVNFQGRTDSIDLGAGDFTASAIYSPAPSASMRQ